MMNTKNQNDPEGAIATVLFTNAVKTANNGNLKKAVAIAEKSIRFLKCSSIGYEIIYILGFYCQICLDTNRNDRAVWSYNSAMRLINEDKDNIDSHEEDREMFLKLKPRVDKFVKLTIN